VGEVVVLKPVEPHLKHPSTMLFLIGLGLGDENDVTVKGANAIRSCSKVFLEMYTSVLGVDVKKLVGNVVGDLTLQVSTRSLVVPAGGDVWKDNSDCRPWYGRIHGGSRHPHARTNRECCRPCGRRRFVVRFCRPSSS
jgi:hypothetical protein